MPAKTPWILLSLTALATLATTATAQEPPDQRFTGQIEVTEVLLDVVVTDGDGNVILGLQPDDFVVEDNGEPVELTGATFYSNRRFLESAALAERLGVSASDVPVDRYFVLFIDDPRQLFPSMTSELMDAVRWAKRWVHQELLPNDYVAVLSYDTRLKVQQDFTTDNEDILRALDAVVRGSDPGDNWPSRAGLDRGDGPSLRVNLPQGKDLRQASTKIQGALETVAEAAGYITGRKNLLLFSIGFGNNNDFADPGTAGSFAAGRNFETFSPDARYYPSMMEALNDNNVAVYSISLGKNLQNENLGTAFLNNGLSLIADDTGGHYYNNFTNFRDPLRQVVDDNNGYYLLSYAARHPAGESGYQEVDVRTTNPDFVVRYRKGYRYGS